jgi:ribosome maturation factor RimP
MPRQYTKHIGRDFEIKLLDDTKLIGTLTEFNTNELKLEYTEREDKAIGKGKVNVIKHHIIPHNQIKESKIKLKF